MPYIEQRPVTQQQPPIWALSSDCVFTLTPILDPRHWPDPIQSWAMRRTSGSTGYKDHKIRRFTIEVHRGQVTEYVGNVAHGIIRAGDNASRSGNVTLRTPPDFEMYTDQDVNRLVWSERLANITYKASVGTEILWHNTARQAAGKYRVEAGHPPGCTTTWRLSSNTRAIIFRGWLSTTENNATLTAGYAVEPSVVGMIIDIKAPSDHHWALYELTNAERLNMAARRAA